MHFELITTHGVAQLLLELELLEGSGVHLLVVEAEACPAIGLGGVHGRIGVAHQLVGVLAILRIDGNADTRRDDGIVRLQRNRFGQGVDYAARDALDVRRVVHVGQDDGELIAPQAGDFRAAASLCVVIRKVADRIVLAEFAAEAPGNFHQQAVTARVADRVIDALEVVEVDEHQCRHRLVPAGALQDAAELFVEAAPVRQAGQRVKIGEVAEAVFLALEDIESFARAQHVLHIAAEQGPVDRLGLVLRGAGTESLVDRFPVVRAGHDHDRHTFALGHGANAAAYLEAAHAGHLDIEEYQVGPLAHEAVQRLMPVAGLDHRDTLVFEALAGKETHVEIIVSDEDPWCGRQRRAVTPRIVSAGCQ